MRAQVQTRAARTAVAGLIAVWVASAAWTLARTPGPVHHRATAAAGAALGTDSDGERSEAPDDNPQAGGPSSQGLHEGDETGGGEAVGPSPSPSPKRGIRPPWRENAVPELRNQPGKRQRKLTA